MNWSSRSRGMMGGSALRKSEIYICKITIIQVNTPAREIKTYMLHIFQIFYICHLSLNQLKYDASEQN